MVARAMIQWVRWKQIQKDLRLPHAQTPTCTHVTTPAMSPKDHVLYVEGCVHDTLQCLCTLDSIPTSHHRQSMQWSSMQISHWKLRQDSSAEKHQLLLQRASENWFSAPTRQLTTICNCSTKGPDTLCWPLRSPTCTNIYIA